MILFCYLVTLQCNVSFIIIYINNISTSLLVTLPTGPSTLTT